MSIEFPLAALIHRERIGKFLSVGALGAGIETVMIALLTTTAGFEPLAAKAVGAEASISTMFVINDQWTFVDNGDVSLIGFARRWGKSHLVRAVGLGVGFAVLFTLTSVMEFSVLIAGLELWPTIANVIGIGIGLGFNYVAESIFTWRIK